MIKFIKTTRLFLSPLSPNDISGDYKNWINSQEADLCTQHAIFPKSEIVLEKYYQNKIIARDCIWLGIFICETNLHIGNIDISSINWINRTGIYNIIIGNREQQGQGYAFEASIALLDHAFNRLNLNRIQLGVEVENKAAIKLYKKIGFIEEGLLRSNICKKGKYHDSLIMGLLKDDFKFRL